MRNDVPRLRGARGWTQEELAARLGVSRQTVMSIEHGRHDPSLALALRIARVFATRLEDVFTPDD